MNNITDNEFQESIKEGIVLIDFWAPWCQPCKMLGPILEKVSKSSDAKIFKINIDENKGTAVEYGIRSIPTMLFFKDGNLAETMTGLRSEQIIAATLAKLAER